MRPNVRRLCQIVTLLAMGCGAPALSQTLPYEWVSHVQSATSLGFAASQSLAVDAAGNCYVTGHYQGVAHFGSTQLIGRGVEDNAFVAKFDSLGKLLWVKGAGGSTDRSGRAYGRALAVDGRGNLFVTGYFLGMGLFGSDVFNSSSGGTMFIASYTTGGDLNWVKQYGGFRGTPLCESIAIDSSGDLFVGGTFRSSTTSFGRTVLTNSSPPSLGSSDLFVAKLDQAGDVLWARSSGGLEDDSSAVVRVVAPGGAVLAGISENEDRPSPFLAKYDAAGNLVWERKIFKGRYDSGWIAGLVVDDKGHFHVTGVFIHEATIENHQLGPLNDSRGEFVAEFGWNGELIWALGGRGTGEHYPSGIALDAGGNRYVVGHYSGSLLFGGLTLPALGVRGLCIIKISAGGEVEWTYGVGGPDNDLSAAAIGTDSTGSTYLTGSFRGSLALGQTNLPSSGGYGLFIIKGPRPPPAIVSGPQSQTVKVGEDVTFRALAVGQAPLSYQWLFNGAIIHGATAPTLVLSNTTHAHAGFYSVVVTNPASTVTSDPAQLLFTFLTLNMYAGLTIDGEIGERFRIEVTSADGKELVWQPLTHVTLTTTPFFFIDRESPGVARRYYRAIPVRQ